MRRNNMTSRNHGAAGGPLMTDHIQLHDIDLELELLKRKREMIEEQQQMLRGPSFNRPVRRPFEYDNEPRRPLLQGIQPFNSSFSEYIEPQQSNSYGSGGLLGKRPMKDHQPWQNSSMFYSPGSQDGAKRKFNSDLGYKPQGPHTSKPFSQKYKPQPNKGLPKPNFPSQRFSTPKTNKPVKNDFLPTKVGKPKPAGLPHKLGSYPTPDRARLVNQTGPKRPRRDNQGDTDFILRNDKVPSQQLGGRLELALGQILKDIKTKHRSSESFTASFQSLSVQRQSKQVIRERLRSVMMGKYVGKVGDIVEHYRKVFPVATDAEILKIAMDVQDSAEAKQLAIKLEDAGTTYKYIKDNLSRLLEVTLDDIFAKVQTLYENETETTREICSKILAEKVSNTSGDTENQDVKDEENTTNEPAEDANISDTKTDAMDCSLHAEIAENVNESVNTAEDQTKDEKNTEVDSDNEPERVKIETPAKLDKLVLSLIRRRLPFILPRYKSMLMNILNDSNSYQVTKDAIMVKAQQKLDIDKRVQEAEKSFAKKRKSSSNEKTANNTESASPGQPKLPVLYMVKILGRPVLPKRRIMQAFLKDYKPSSVKKHRTMHLLFVTFSNQEDFDSIVALKETTLGDCTISIKVSERTVVKADESLNITGTSLNESTEDTAISSDLDNQIDDLLLSIRKEEESKDDVTSELGSQDDANAGETEANNVDTEVAEAMETNGTVEDDASEVTNDAEVTDAPEATEIPEETETNTEAQDETVSEEVKDTVKELKNDTKESGRATPTRASSRLANVTPCSVRTRRASRLANNN